jgi:hypothetical protein
MQLKPLSEMLKLSKEKLEEILAPTRVRKMKAKADLESAKLEEQAAGLEQEIATLATAKDIDFAKLTDKMDELALTNRKITQLDEIIAQLFPPASQTGLAD